MRKAFRRLLEAVERLSAALRELAASQRDLGPALDRLEALEVSHGQWEAQVEATLMKAEGKLQAANNAEARTRTMKKSYERFIDPLDPDSQEEVPQDRDQLPLGDAYPGLPEEVQPLHMGVASDDKAPALSAKFG